jgi:chaperonin cofactor prefoldin
MMYLNFSDTQKETKPQINRRKEITNMKVEIKEIKTKRTKQRIKEMKSRHFKR